jgi:hypothetical protein
MVVIVLVGYSSNGSSRSSDGSSGSIDSVMVLAIFDPLLVGVVKSGSSVDQVDY